MAEALFGEVRWRGPTRFESVLSAEEDASFTEDLEVEDRHTAFHKYSAYWEPKIRRRHRVIYSVDNAASVLENWAPCSSEMWNTLSVFVHNIESSLAAKSQYVRSCWDLPTLTTRSDDESATTVEAQLERLERCSGPDISNAIRAELKQQIENADEEDARVPIAALVRLVDFLCAHPRVKPPFLFTTNETIKAQWQPSPERIAWIEFNATEQVRLLAFCSDPRAAGGLKRFVGNSTLQSAFRDLLRLGVDWIIR